MNPFYLARHVYLQLKGLLVFGRGVSVYGDFTVVNPKNVRIGRNCAINHGVHILGRCRVEIGDGVVLSAGAMLIDSGLDLRNYANIEAPAHVDSFVVVEDGAWIGVGAILLPGVTVGRKSVVGAGSVVTKDVPPLTIVAGVPARAVGRTDA